MIWNFVFMVCGLWFVVWDLLMLNFKFVFWDLGYGIWPRCFGVEFGISVSLEFQFSQK